MLNLLPFVEQLNGLLETAAFEDDVVVDLLFAFRLLDWNVILIWFDYCWLGLGFRLRLEISFIGWGFWVGIYFLDVNKMGLPLLLSLRLDLLFFNLDRTMSPLIILFLHTHDFVTILDLVNQRFQIVELLILSTEPDAVIVAQCLPYQRLQRTADGLLPHNVK